MKILEQLEDVPWDQVAGFSGLIGGGIFVLLALWGILWGTVWLGKKIFSWVTEVFIKKLAK